MKCRLPTMCETFGHKLPRGYGGGVDDPPYVSFGHMEVDGIGTRHADITVTCDRCGERYVVAKVHLPKEWKT